MATLSQNILKAIMCHHQPNVAQNDVSITAISTGKFNDSYFVSTPTEELVLRIAPPRDAVFCFYEKNMMQQEPGIHQLLREKTEIPVAKIHVFDDSLTHINRDYMIMDRLPGLPLSDAPGIDFDYVLHQVGNCLAQSHAQHAETCGYIGAHHPMPPYSNWAEAFHHMWNRLIDDIVSVKHYNNEESTSFRSLLDQHLPLFDRPVPFSLLHMDIWHQNIMVDQTGKVTGIIDWDRALWGDPEIEFAVLDYCGISKPAFWEGYGSQRDESHEAQIRQIFYLLYELQKYIVIRQGRGNDSARALQYKQQVFQIIQQTFSN